MSYKISANYCLSLVTIRIFCSTILLLCVTLLHCMANNNLYTTAALLIMIPLFEVHVHFLCTVQVWFASIMHTIIMDRWKPLCSFELWQPKASTFIIFYLVQYFRWSSYQNATFCRECILSFWWKALFYNICLFHILICICLFCYIL